MATKSKDFHPKTEFRIEPPVGRSRSFRIRYKSIETKNLWSTVKKPEIDLVNADLKAGKIGREMAKEHLKVILASLYRDRDRTKKKPAFLQDNLAIVDEMAKEKYNARRRKRMKRPEESINDLKRAAEAAGMLPLRTCDLEDLEEHLDNTLGDKPKTHKRRITWINSILRYLGRESIETIKNNGRPLVKYLNESEFQRVLSHLKEPDRLLAEIAFYTGLRLGEIFYIQPKHVRQNTIWVEFQMTDIWLEAKQRFKIDTPKTGVERDALLPKRVRATVLKWAAIPLEDREQWRRLSFTHNLRRACQKVFSDQEKHLNFHALRHCNAIWLLHEGASIHEVAQLLGNTVAVAERYYSGFAAKKETIDRLADMIDKKKTPA